MEEKALSEKESLQLIIAMMTKAFAPFIIIGITSKNGI